MDRIAAPTGVFPVRAVLIAGAVAIACGASRDGDKGDGVSGSGPTGGSGGSHTTGGAAGASVGGASVTGGQAGSGADGGDGGTSGIGGEAGSAGATGDGGTDGGPLEPEVGFLYWVDPARCLTPCTADPSAHLVVVDSKGLVTDTSELRFDRTGQPALAAFIQGAEEAGHIVEVGSPYRDYQTQLDTWVTVTEIGRAARPGHSEHQIGTAVDLAYDGVQAESWLAEHAFEYGFALSFPRGTEKLSGIRHEPWHFRYVGTTAASEIHQNGWAVVEYLRAHPELARSGDCSDCPSRESWQACGDLDWAGLCEGTVLRWCLDGAAGAVDCASTGLTCDVDAGGEATCQ